MPAAETPAGRALGDARRGGCDATELSDERLVIDWSPLDRSKLEAVARRGLVPVRVDGCRTRIVDGCTVRRQYAFTATSRQREVLRLSDRDEVDAKLPVLALRFGASLTRATSLDVAMTVVGRYEGGAVPVATSELEGACDGATHVVASLSVGAFAIGAASAITAEGSAELARASHAREWTHLDAAGVEASCSTARRADGAPPDDCSIPLRLELRALRPASAVVEAPRAAPTVATGSDAEAMRRAMEAARKELAWCHRVARASSPDLSGVLNLSVKLARSGNVRSVAAKHEGNVDDALADCAIERVGHVAFPPAEDDRPRAVLIPVLFRPLAR
jgi:hypothetical protein